MRWFAAVSLAIALAIVSGVAGAEEATWAPDETGKRMRMRFDPGARVLIGAGYTGGYRGEPGGVADEPQRALMRFETGISYRHFVDYQDLGVTWKLYHDIVHTQVTHQGEVEGALYAGRYMRWSEQGSIVLPTNPPRSLPFPLNIGLETQVGNLTLRKPAGDDYRATIGVVDARIALDFWRQRRLRSYAQVAVGPNYAIEQTADTTQHLVTPFSAGSFAVHHESSDGHHAVHLGIVGGYRLRVAQGFSPYAQAMTSYEALLFGINDMPVTAYVALAYRYQAEPVVTDREHELRANAGLRFAVPLTGWPD